MTATLSPTKLALILRNELTDLIEDAGDAVPVHLSDVDATALAEIRRSLSLAIGATYRLEDAIEHMERCRKARLGMLADLGDAVVS